MLTSISIVILAITGIVITFHNRAQDKRIEKLQEAVVLLMMTEPAKPVVGVFPRPFDKDELWATPQRYVLGLDTDSFKDKDGNPVDAWKTYMDKMWMTPAKPANTINNHYTIDSEASVEAIKAMFNSMPTREANQLADGIGKLDTDDYRKG